MMSMWARYRTEFGNSIFVEKDFGFFSYSILPDCIFLEDVWIEPDKRKSGLSKGLYLELENVARQNGKHFILARITLDSKVIPGNIKFALAMDFVPFKAHNNDLWFRRDVKG